MVIYTDGSAFPTNPSSHAAYSIIVLDDNENLIHTYRKVYNEGLHTNNEMEMKAILYSLLVYGRSKDEPNIFIPTVYSDSTYAINCFTQWGAKWERDGWIKSDGKTPENLKLIQAYLQLTREGHEINLQKVKAHKDNKWNNMADKLAREGTI